MLPANGGQQHANTNGGAAAKGTLSAADLALKESVKDLCYYHQTHEHGMICQGYIAGTCKKRHELCPSKKAFKLLNPPHELQKVWKEYRLKCEEWNTEVSNPIIAANKAKGKGKDGKGGAKSDGKGGGKGGDKGKGDSKGGGNNTPRGGAPPTKDGKANTKGDAKGGGKDGKGGGKGGKKGRRNRARSATLQYFGRADQIYDPNARTFPTTSKVCTFKAYGWPPHRF